MNKLVQSLGMVLLVCVGVRVGAWLVEPVLPLLGGLVVFALIVAWMLSKHGPPGGFR